MLNDAIVKQFNDFKEKTGKYKDLYIEKIIMDKRELDSLVEFKNGSGGYTKKYSETNPGEFPLMTGSLEVKSYVKPIDERHVIEDESVSYNKDNDSGSQAFYHNKPYIVGAHHYAVFIKENQKENLTVKYLYYMMKNIFDTYKFYQSKNVANSSLIGTFDVYVPRKNDDYTSVEIQEAIVEFLDRTEKLRDKMYSLEHKTEKVYEAIISKIFLTGDPFISDKFNKWADDNSYNIRIDDISFEPKLLSEVATFPRMQMALGTPDLSIQEYEHLTEDEQHNYIPLIGGTLENNQVSGYFHKDNIRAGAISEPNIISWTRINGKHFFIQKNPVCTNDDSYFMKVNEDNLTEFIQMSLIVFMRHNNADWGNKIGKKKMMGVEVMIPKATKNYSSVEVQGIFLEFIKKFRDLNAKTLECTSSVIENCNTIDKIFLQNLFKDQNND